MVKQLESFKHYLETFASKHQNDIKKNPEFRKHFQKLCAQIGVDPLACRNPFFDVLLFHAVTKECFLFNLHINESCDYKKLNVCKRIFRC